MTPTKSEMTNAYMGTGEPPVPSFNLQPFDLHAHTRMSDGTDSPAELVRNAAAAGLVMVAITDHDTVAGVPEALAEAHAEATAALKTGTLSDAQAAAGAGANVRAPRPHTRVIPGVELDVQNACTLHILGLGIDAWNQSLTDALETTRLRREARNSAMLSKLACAGMDIAESAAALAHGTLTRAHMARALVSAGYAESTDDAFRRFLDKGGVGYVESEHITKREAIDVIHAAGGIAVLAHPCKLRCDAHALVYELAGLGLDGIEAFYPTSTPGQRALFLSMAAQYGLMVTAGSDYHGAMRAQARLGCAYCDDPTLYPVFKWFMERPVSFLPHE